MPNGTLVVANGRNEFGAFISAGYIDTNQTATSSFSTSGRGGRIGQLLLARRYLEDSDIRTTWSLKELYEKVRAADQGFFELRHDCATIKIRSAPWRTLDLHAKTTISKKSSTKRKRADDTNDDDGLPPLSTPPSKTFDPTLIFDMKEDSMLGTLWFHLVSQVQWLGQCYGCGKCLGQDTTIVHNYILIYRSSSCDDIGEPETEFCTYYCTPECVKKQGAKAWADASRAWRQKTLSEDSFWGYSMQGTVDDMFWQVVESDPELVQMMTSAGWEGPGDWRLEPMNDPEEEEGEGKGGGDY